MVEYCRCDRKIYPMDKTLRAQVIRLGCFLTSRSRYQQYRAILPVLEFSTKEVEAIQRTKIRRLLDHCFNHVPYYRRLFSETRFQWQKAECLSDLESLPPLTRDVINDNINDLLADNIPLSQRFLNSTGGSTGTPVNFWQEREFAELSRAAVWRAWSIAGWQPGDKVAWIWGGPIEVSQWETISGRLKDVLTFNLGLNAFAMSNADFSMWETKINRFRPRFLVGYPSALSCFSEFVVERGIRLPNICAVFSTAEKLLPQQRKLIEQAFSARVFDWYGSREIRCIAFECLKGNMHIASDLCGINTWCRFEGAQNAHSRLLITSFDCLSMPLLRYDIGDCGTFPEQPCSCGLPFPCLRVGVGRVTDNFLTREGSIIHGEYFTHLFYGIEGIARFQVRQTSLDRVTIYLVKNKHFSQISTKLIADVCKEIERALGLLVSVNLIYVDAIPLSPGGKHLFTISDIVRQTN